MDREKKPEIFYLYTLKYHSHTIKKAFVIPCPWDVGEFYAFQRFWIILAAFNITNFHLNPIGAGLADTVAE